MLWRIFGGEKESKDFPYPETLQGTPSTVNLHATESSTAERSSSASVSRTQAVPFTGEVPSSTAAGESSVPESLSTRPQTTVPYVTAGVTEAPVSTAKATTPVRTVAPKRTAAPQSSTAAKTTAAKTTAKPTAPAVTKPFSVYDYPVQTALAATCVYRQAVYADLEESGSTLPVENAVVLTKINEEPADGVYVIPETLDGKTVVGIDPKVIRQDRGLRVKTLVIPATVKTVAAQAFHSCMNLEELYLCAEATEIDCRAFYCDWMGSANDPQGGYCSENFRIHCVKSAMDYYRESFRLHQDSLSFSEWDKSFAFAKANSPSFGKLYEAPAYPVQEELLPYCRATTRNRDYDSGSYVMFPHEEYLDKDAPVGVLTRVTAKLTHGVYILPEYVNGERIWYIDPGNGSPLFSDEVAPYVKVLVLPSTVRVRPGTFANLTNLTAVYICDGYSWFNHTVFMDQSSYKIEPENEIVIHCSQRCRYVEGDPLTDRLEKLGLKTEYWDGSFDFLENYL